MTKAFSPLAASKQNLVKIAALGIVSTIVFAASAFARDSSWLLGDNGHVAINILEHRAGADTRATDVTLIFGSHLLQGTLDNTDSGKITLREKEKDGYTFSGTIGVNYEKVQITLKGKLLDTDSAHTVIATYDATIKCKELQGDQ